VKKTIGLLVAAIFIFATIFVPAQIIRSHFNSGTAASKVSGSQQKQLTKTGSYTANSADIKASNATVTDVASAIKANDVKTFTSLMSSRVMSNVKGIPDLTSPEAAAFAAALSSARLVKAESDAFVYETTVNGTAITFLVIKEGGVWKIAEQ
jgi:predicted lipid-binding transport protein (Tim44 family)